MRCSLRDPFAAFVHLVGGVCINELGPFRSPHQTEPIDILSPSILALLPAIGMGSTHFGICDKHNHHRHSAAFPLCCREIDGPHGLRWINCILLYAVMFAFGMARAQAFGIGVRNWQKWNDLRYWSDLLSACAVDWQNVKIEVSNPYGLEHLRLSMHWSSATLHTNWICLTTRDKRAGAIERFAFCRKNLAQTNEKREFMHWMFNWIVTLWHGKLLSFGNWHSERCRSPFERQFVPSSRLWNFHCISHFKCVERNAIRESRYFWICHDIICKSVYRISSRE